jgi:hypothetical protein
MARRLRDDEPIPYQLTDKALKALAEPQAETETEAEAG